MRTLLLVVLIAPLCSGCAALGVHKVVRELAKDPATVRLRVPTPYGPVELDRVNRSDGIPYTITRDGVEVGDGRPDEGQTITVPLKIKVQQP